MVVLCDPLLDEAGFAALDLPATARVDLPGPEDPSELGAALLAAADLVSARRSVSAVPSSLTARAVGVVVARASAPPLLTTRPEWPRLLHLRAQTGDRTAAVAHFAEPAPVAEVLAAFLRSLTPHRIDPPGWPTVGAPAEGPHRWPVGDRSAVIGPGDAGPDLAADFPPDLVVADDEPPSTPAAANPHPVVVRHPVTVAAGPDLTWERYDDAGLARLRDTGPVALGGLDDRLLNPVGFKRQHRQPVAHLVPHEDVDRLELRTAKGTTLLSARHGPSEQDLDGLRRLAAVHLSWEGARGPHAYARVVAGLAMAGVPLVCGAVPAWAAALLHPDVVAALEQGSTGATAGAGLDLADIVAREAHSIRLRRAALRHHSASGWRRAAGRTHGLQTMPEPTVSVLLPTRRPEQVAFALRQVARQRAARVELVLVTHGFTADPAELDAFRAGSGMPLTVLEAPADQVFGSILNSAGRAASGDVLLKMDDDDWYGRDFVADLLLARSYSGADVVGTPPEFTYVEPLRTTVRRQDATEAYRPIVAGGTMLVDRGTFTAVGGFRETRKFVDAGLLAAVRDAGGTVYRSHGHGYVLRRGAQGHTWDPGLGYFVSRRLSWHQWRGFRPSPLLDPDEADRPREGP